MDITPCSLVQTYLPYVATNSFVVELQVARAILGKLQTASGFIVGLCFFLYEFSHTVYYSTLKKEAARFFEMLVTFNALHSVASQKAAFFIVTALITSDHTQHPRRQCRELEKTRGKKLRYLRAV